MKNLSKRNKMFLGIGGAVVVLAVLVGVFFQVGGAGLFGASVVTIAPTNPTIALGSTIKMTATTTVINVCSWSSSNTQVAGVNSSNRTATITGRAGGTATITIKCGTLSASTTVTVASISTNGTVLMGGTKVFTVNVGQGITATWASNNEAVMKLTSSSTGNTASFKVLAPGSVKLTARWATGSVSANISVPAPTMSSSSISTNLFLGDITTFTVNNAAPDATFTWATSNASVAKIVSSSGNQATYEGLAQGKVNAKVTINGTTTTLNSGIVVPAPSISPAQSSILLSNTMGFTVSYAANRPLTWESTGILQLVSSSGTTATFKAVDLGRDTIRVKWTDASGQVFSTSTWVDSGIAISPNTAEVAQENTQTFTTQELPSGATVSWSSNDTNTANLVSASGNSATFRAGSPYGATISATVTTSTGRTSSASATFISYEYWKMIEWTSDPHPEWIGPNTVKVGTTATISIAGTSCQIISSDESVLWRTSEQQWEGRNDTYNGYMSTATFFGKVPGTVTLGVGGENCNLVALMTWLTGEVEEDTTYTPSVYRRTDTLLIPSEGIIALTVTVVP